MPFLFALAAISACSDGSQLLRWSGPTMGTVYHITVSADAGAAVRLDQQLMAESVEVLLAEINSQMSTYDPQSELSRFNRLAAGQCRVLSDSLAEVIALSFKVYKASQGAFDVTVGPLVNRWGFGPEAGTESLPTEKEIEALRARVGMHWLAFDSNSAELCKQADVEIDLSAIAKGYAVDRVASVLESFGARNYLVDIGGEVRTHGNSPRGGPWRLAVEKPAMTRGSVQELLALRDAAVATSGDYRNYREVDGERFSHTIDPRDGYPVRHNTASVTVIAKSAAEADAWATALNTAGFVQARALAKEYRLAVYLVQRAGSQGNLAGEIEMTPDTVGEPPHEQAQGNPVEQNALEFTTWYSEPFEPFIIKDS